MTLASELRAAMADHGREWPHGDWREVNKRLGALRLQAMAIDDATCGMGNEMCAAHLEALDTSPS